MTRLAKYIATVFGIGVIPYAPGTAASIVALPIAWLITWKAGEFVLFGSALVLAAVGVWASDVHARATGNPDPSECVIDEVAGQWLACVLAPLSPLGFALAFVLFRLFDITKLWPVSAAEKLRGGYGIMADDLVAGLFAAVLVAALANFGLVR